MFKLASICLLIATIVFSVGVCFSKNRSLSITLQILCLLSSSALTIVVAFSKNSFDTYPIVFVCAILSQALAVFVPEKQIKFSDTNSEQNADEVDEIDENNENEDLSNENIDQNETDEHLTEENVDDEHFVSNENVSLESVEEQVRNVEGAPQQDISEENKKIVSSTNCFQNAPILGSIANLITAILIGVCGLYLGLEKPYGYLLGVSIACAVCFLILGLDKKLTLKQALALLLSFMSAGIALSQIATVLIYSCCIKNLLFCLSSSIFAIYASVKAFKNTKYTNLIFYASALVFVLTFLF